MTLFARAFSSNTSSYKYLDPNGTKILPTIATSLLFQVLDHFAARIESRCAGDAAAGMSSRSTQIQSFHRRSVLRGAKERPEREQLIERHRTVVNVPTG